MKEFILIVEKDDILRSNIFDSLELEGYNVISAENGVLGLQLAKEFQPDLILCEVDLPDFNGYEVAKKLREDLTTAKIPVIFLTSEPDNETDLDSIP